MVKAGQGFPKKMLMTHKYCEHFTMTSTSSVIAKKQVSCNGMYDPDAGHQPLYFDQMTALYDHYTVIGSKIRAVVTPTTATDESVMFGIYLDDDTNTTTVGGIDTLREQSSGYGKVISAGAVRPTYFQRKWSAKKTFGGSILGNDNLQGTVAANPTEQTYFTLAVQSFDTAVTTAVNVAIEVTYIAIWDELKEVAQS